MDGAIDQPFFEKTIMEHIPFPITFLGQRIYIHLYIYLSSLTTKMMAERLRAREYLS
jgi:hypothetical protein